MPREVVTQEDCSDDGCRAVRLPTGAKCWTHANKSELAEALRLVSDTGAVDATGAHITAELLERILSVAPEEDGHSVLTNARFAHTTFKDSAVFEGVIFRGTTLFDFAVFHRQACFNRASFENWAGFGEAKFRGGAEFEGATFHGQARFEGGNFGWTTATFERATFRDSATFDFAAFGPRGAGFQEATFTQDAWFRDTTFQGDASFSCTTFGRDTAFERATFYSQAEFDQANFQRDTMFAGMTFDDDATFTGATFEQAHSVGPLVARRGLVLDGVRFAHPVQIEASTPVLRCRQARFSGGVQLWLRSAQVILDDSDFSAPSILTGIPPIHTGIPHLAEHYPPAQEPGANPYVPPWLQEFVTSADRPRLLSLRRADLAGLALSHIDLTDCRFDSAHNLDKLRIEAGVLPATAPARLGEDRRQVIAEECAWRAQRSRHWRTPPWPEWAGDAPETLEARQIAGLYRALRKAREDNYDQPGAADFYYGEMEMRRHSRITRTASGSDGTAIPRGRAERGILTAYWLVSGYGLRAWRALACLAALIAGLAVAFHLIGFTTPPQPASYWTSLLYAFRATLSLTDDEVKLTAWGRLFQALLRLTGPVLLGLALLAVRNRVKR